MRHSRQFSTLFAPIAPIASAAGMLLACCTAAAQTPVNDVTIRAFLESCQRDWYQGCPVPGALVPSNGSGGTVLCAQGYNSGLNPLGEPICAPGVVGTVPVPPGTTVCQGGGLPGRDPAGRPFCAVPLPTPTPTPTPVPPHCGPDSSSVSMNALTIGCTSPVVPLPPTPLPDPCTVKSLRYQPDRICEITTDPIKVANDSIWTTPGQLTPGQPTTGDGFYGPGTKDGSVRMPQIEQPISLVPVPQVYSSSAYPNGFDPATVRGNGVAFGATGSTAGGSNTAKASVPSGLMMPSLYKAFVSESAVAPVVNPMPMPPVTPGISSSFSLPMPISLAPVTNQSAVSPAPKVIMPIRQPRYELAQE